MATTRSSSRPPWAARPSRPPTAGSTRITACGHRTGGGSSSPMRSAIPPRAGVRAVAAAGSQSLPCPRRSARPCTALRAGRRTEVAAASGIPRPVAPRRDRTTRAVRRHGGIADGARPSRLQRPDARRCPRIPACRAVAEEPRRPPLLHVLISCLGDLPRSRSPHPVLGGMLLAACAFLLGARTTEAHVLDAAVATPDCGTSTIQLHFTGTLMASGPFSVPYTITFSCSDGGPAIPAISDTATGHGLRRWECRLRWPRASRRRGTGRDRRGARHHGAWLGDALHPVPTRRRGRHRAARRGARVPWLPRPQVGCA